MEEKRVENYTRILGPKKRKKRRIARGEASCGEGRRGRRSSRAIYSREKQKGAKPGSRGRGRMGTFVLGMYKTKKNKKNRGESGILATNNEKEENDKPLKKNDYL